MLATSLVVAPLATPFPATAAAAGAAGLASEAAWAAASAAYCAWARTWVDRGTPAPFLLPVPLLGRLGALLLLPAPARLLDPGGRPRFRFSAPSSPVAQQEVLTQSGVRRPRKLKKTLQTKRH